MAEDFELGYETGAMLVPFSIPYGCELFIFAQNPTAFDKTVRAIGYSQSGVLFDSDVDFDIEAGPTSGRVPAHGLWVYPRRLYTEDPHTIWIVLWSTSEQVVPSVQLFEIQEGMGFPRRVISQWVNPGDFAIRRNPFHKRPSGEVVGPSEIGPVLNP